MPLNKENETEPVIQISKQFSIQIHAFVHTNDILQRS